VSTVLVVQMKRMEAVDPSDRVKNCNVRTCQGTYTELFGIEHLEHGYRRIAVIV